MLKESLNDSFTIRNSVVFARKKKISKHAQAHLYSIKEKKKGKEKYRATSLELSPRSYIRDPPGARWVSQDL